MGVTTIFKNSIKEYVGIIIEQKEYKKVIENESLHNQIQSQNSLFFIQ